MSPQKDTDVIDATPPARPASYDKKVALVLQGGGALGSYQAGVYEALASSEYLPDWVAGISIGAINCALIAGNALENRVTRMRSFWEEVTPHQFVAGRLPSVDHLLIAGRWSSLAALMFGQPGFFAPRPMLGLDLVSQSDQLLQHEFAQGHARAPGRF